MDWGRIARDVGRATARAVLTKATQSKRRTRSGTRPSRSSAVRRQRLAYAPQRDGRADPGEVVWTWVSYEEDPSRGKDRPVVVMGRDRNTVLGLMLSSNASRAGQADWLSLGTGAWDGEDRPSWVRLDRVLELTETGIRREGAILDRERFDRIAARLRSAYGWDD